MHLIYRCTDFFSSFSPEPTIFSYWGLQKNDQKFIEFPLNVVSPKMEEEEKYIAL